MSRYSAIHIFSILRRPNNEREREEGRELSIGKKWLRGGGERDFLLDKV
jgi:hypothetical protein